MQSKNKNTYPENFRKAVRHWMADNDLENVRKAAPLLNLTYMALYKIMDGTNSPTAEHGINLCRLAGFDANWLFLNIGEMYHQQTQSLYIMNRNIKEIKQLLTRLTKQD